MDDRMRRVAVTTLGCKINAYESELIAASLPADRWRPVRSGEHADLYVINTCTVTAEAGRQARQAVRRAVRQNPDAMVVVTGCHAQMNREQCADIPGVDLVLGNDRKLELPRLLPELESGALPKVLVGDLDEHVSLPAQLLDGYAGRTRAFVQVQQGCNQGCTFCIIHRARGPSRSLPPTQVRRQVERLALNDYPEIVLCGVDLGSYGEDFTDNEGRGYQLNDLIENLLTVESEHPLRLRLSSIDPAHLDDRLIDLLAEQDRLCPHLHLSLQSGNSLILKRMKRRYSAEHVYERVERLRARLPGLVLSADVMVGFPTESDAQFEDTVRMIQDLDIAYPHIFTYSARAGTPAARIPADRQVPTPVRKQRAERLREVAADLKQRLLARKLGATGWVLPEAAHPERPAAYKARGEDYVPAILRDPGLQAGRWRRARFTALEHGELLAEPLE